LSSTGSHLGTPALGQPAVDCLRTRIQGSSPPRHDAAQPLHGTVFSRRSDGAGGGTPPLLRVPAARGPSVRWLVRANGQLAGAGARAGNGSCPAAGTGRP